MKEIVTSLRKVKLQKDIQNLLKQYNLNLIKNSNMSTIFMELYRQDIIDREHYMYLEMKKIIKQFCISSESISTKHRCMLGDYLYEQDNQRLWVGGHLMCRPVTTNIAMGYI